MLLYISSHHRPYAEVLGGDGERKCAIHSETIFSTINYLQPPTPGMQTVVKDVMMVCNL